MKIWSSINLPWGHARSHKKFEPEFSRFDVYWIQTNKQTNKQTDRQTNRQTDKPNLYIDELIKFQCSDLIIWRSFTPSSLQYFNERFKDSINWSSSPFRPVYKGIYFERKIFIITLPTITPPKYATAEDPSSLQYFNERIKNSINLSSSPFRSVYKGTYFERKNL